MKEALAHFPHIWLTCGGLLIFFSIFVGSLLWVCRPKAKKLYAYVQDLPFQGDAHDA